MEPSPGISNLGRDAEEEFFRLTGARPVPRAALGDALLDGHLIEIKKASASTLNQVRAVKYITLAAKSSRHGKWFVVPASEIVRQCATKARGQHTESPFESATLNLNNLSGYAIDDERHIREAVMDAITEAERYPELRQLMRDVLNKSVLLAEESIAEVRQELRRLGLA